MSLFDVLRYPISLPPTLAELEALPPALYLLWMHESSWGRVTNRDSCTPEWVASWYERNWQYMQKETSKYYEDFIDLETLRAIIKNWNPPE